MKITIIIPTFNRKNHLEAVLFCLTRSLLCNEDINIIVVDNCSPYDIHSVCQIHSDMWQSRFALYRWEANTGSMESNLFSLINSTPPPNLGSHVWVLGDDDMPTNGFLKQLSQKIILLENSELLISIHTNKFFEPNDCLVGTCYRDVDSYFLEMIKNGAFQSIYGFTFISSVILPRQMFMSSYTASYKHPICLSCLAHLAQPDRSQTYSIIMVPSPFVHIAFTPLSIYSSKLYIENQVSSSLKPQSIDEYFCTLIGNWLCIAGNSFFFEQFNTAASDWYFYSQAQYLRWLFRNTDLKNILLLQLRANVSYLARITAKYFLRFESRLGECLKPEDKNILIQCSTTNIVWNDVGVGFSPINGWVK